MLSDSRELPSPLFTKLPTRGLPGNPDSDVRRSRKPPIAPVLEVYLSSTGAQLFLFASDGCDGYATWAAGLGTFREGVDDVVFLPASLQAGERPILQPFTRCMGQVISCSPLQRTAN